MICLAAVSVSHVVWRGAFGFWPPAWPLHHLSKGYWSDAWVLLFGVLLVAQAPRASGLRIGALRTNWKRVLLVCGLPVLIVAVVYPLLPNRPWHAMSSSMWTLQPLAQDLLFAGFVYRTLDLSFSGRVVRWLPVEWPLLLTSVFFAAWHLPNLRWMASSDLTIQIGYTFLGSCVIGLARQWTGSLYYGLAAHMLANFIAWSIP